MEKNKILIFIMLITTVIFTGCEPKESGLYQLGGGEVTTETLSASDEEVTDTPLDVGEEVTETTSESVDEVDGDTDSDVIPATVFVHICGAVVNPGVYELETGDRIIGAVRAAGGFKEDACEDYVNLAEPLADGMKIVIPTTAQVEETGEETEAVYGIATDAGESTGNHTQTEETDADQNTGDSLININTAGIDELCKLTGIGETKAQAIVSYREASGTFASVEDLMKVNGIGEGTYAKLKDEITVGK